MNRNSRNSANSQGSRRATDSKWLGLSKRTTIQYDTKSATLPSPRRNHFVIPPVHSYTSSSYCESPELLPYNPTDGNIISPLDLGPARYAVAPPKPVKRKYAMDESMLAGSPLDMGHVQCTPQPVKRNYVKAMDEGLIVDTSMDLRPVQYSIPPPKPAKRKYNDGTTIVVTFSAATFAQRK
ncbi:hypothetical protein K474DRAFT_55894 [Panus rudis PR-1116 ss-1]|nr:hypothetical protein K474DRAFT_55894 [Panus rudis PR-1116 ss-1]